MSTITMKRPTVVLSLPGPVPALILYGQLLVQRMTNNTWFPSPSPALAAVDANIDALAAAELLAQSRAKGAAAARNVARKKVEDDLVALRAHVQTIVAANSDDAAAIAESAGMSLKQATPYQKPALMARMGKAPGEVIVRAKAAERGTAYEWQMSADDGGTWTMIGLTTVAEAAVPELNMGATYLFRFRKTVKSTTGSWSQSVRFMVH
jgi:hypothetical protein